MVIKYPEDIVQTITDAGFTDLKIAGWGNGSDKTIAAFLLFVPIKGNAAKINKLIELGWAHKGGKVKECGRYYAQLGYCPRRIIREEELKF